MQIGIIDYSLIKTVNFYCKSLPVYEPFVTSPALLGEYDCRSKNGTANVGEGRGREVGGWGGGWQITQTDCKPEVKKKRVVAVGLIGIRIRMDKNAYYIASLL
jgi:hypothetical protein